jgi:mersacidin/lichenicidin family type 2 lantibiotic
MSNRDDRFDIARAIKDPEYRKSLTPEQLAQLPANPNGEAEADEISEQELNEISGGWIRPPISWGCPQPPYGPHRD